ncbi:hypothetical protein GLE_0974 [Lysobacter enzymogenes]|uniref:Uncharacterized protein n=1 Tax=Lysobacter enzymogenes TaxID=69 RepID=A0A0S2DCU2_LYSEN|nr:hypothetical protein GLE_0974 [Lysobacter enzymogenes]
MPPRARSVGALAGCRARRKVPARAAPRMAPKRSDATVAPSCRDTGRSSPEDSIGPGPRGCATRGCRQVFGLGTQSQKQSGEE